MKHILFLAVPVIVFSIAFRPAFMPGHDLKVHNVHGKITDDAGSPLPGVAVHVKGRSAATRSNVNGEYKISVSSSNSTLIFSAVGYQSKEVKINGRKEINVSLSVKAQELDDVTVTGLKKEQAYGDLNLPSISPRTFSDQIYGSTNPDYGLIDNTYFNTEDYDHITENRFLKVTDNPLSTFSIDVDAASYSNIRRFLNQGELPPAGAVRIEEMINYFRYGYPQPLDARPFSINTEISECPWNSDHKLVLIGLQGKKIPVENLPTSNLVFLIDVSGSMDDPMKLPLVKTSMKMLVDQLREEDNVAIVVYAGAAGLVLPSTSGEEKSKIKDAIDRLNAGGSTAGGEGIKLAYKIARENFVTEGNNRVILCTDGDFNVGLSSDDEMERLIEGERKSGVFLTVLGYGMGNYKDNKMQKLADKGNGNHAYIDGPSEAKKVLVNEFGGTLFTIAKDVKLQVEFNPAKVQGYRLIGYENRMLHKEDFNNDKKDAGELGSGHTVTALYEVIPVGVKSSFLEKVDPLKYQKTLEPISDASFEDEMMNVKFRYKKPDEDISKLIVHPVIDHQVQISNTSNNFRFAASVAEFGMILRNSEFKSDASIENVLMLARKAKGNDEEGYRSEFIKLVESAGSIAKGKKQQDSNLMEEVVTQQK